MAADQTPKRLTAADQIKGMRIIDDLRDGCKKMHEVVVSIINSNTFTIDKKKTP